MPDRRTIDRWRKKYPEFDKIMDDALDSHSEAILIIAQDAVMNAKTMTEAKVADTQQRFLTWLVSRLNRKKYGDKMEIEVTKKLDISPVLAQALENMKKVSINNPPQLIDAEATDIT
jgi:acyl-CoA hydrolase